MAHAQVTTCSKCSNKALVCCIWFCTRHFRDPVDFIFPLLPFLLLHPLLLCSCVFMLSLCMFFSVTHKYARKHVLSSSHNESMQETVMYSISQKFAQTYSFIVYNCFSIFWLLKTSENILLKKNKICFIFQILQRVYLNDSFAYYWLYYLYIDCCNSSNIN